MRQPLFSLKDMKRQLGYWSGDKQEICLNRNLVENHPWGTVREILLHEMAHQLAEQVLGLPDHGSPHGPHFQEACHLLRADPRASSRLDPENQQADIEKTHPEVKIVRQIKKLMALAESQNRNEAEAAMAKAHELIAKYNIDIVSHAKDRDYISLFVGKPALRHRREVYHLASLLLDFYFIEGIWVSAYVLEKSKMGRVLEISGTPHNVDIAGYIHDFVQNYSDAQWKVYNKDKGLNRYRKTDFAIGIIAGFRSKLESRYATGKKAREQFALIKAGDPILKTYISHRYPHTSKVSPSGALQDKRVIEDGIQVGEKMIISKGITTKGGFENRLIEHK
ncbi:MAG: DUF2786 domain-containing protein [Desulfobacterales bacterium]